MLFRRTRDEFCMVVNMEHCVCVVRLLVMLGHLKQAYDLLQTMPISLNGVMLGALI